VRCILRGGTKEEGRRWFPQLFGLRYGRLRHRSILHRNANASLDCVGDWNSLYNVGRFGTDESQSRATPPRNSLKISLAHFEISP
jgi:hypothetical protein